jgi:hypothetical protein
MFAGGLSAFAPLLAQWLKTKYPMAQDQTAGAGAYTAGGNYQVP